MKKEKVWLASVIAFLMTVILLTGFVGRISYESQNRNAFLASNMTSLKAHGKNTIEALVALRDAGSQVVTVDPLTIKGLQEAGRLELISYSSLSINQDVISQEIRSVLGDYPMQPENLVAVVPDAALGQFLTAELSYRYTDYGRYVLGDGQTTVFAFSNLTAENDLIAGYDYDELALIEYAGMKAAVTYPSYTFENPVYPQYFKQFITSNGVSFLILRNNPYDNRKPLSEEMKTALRASDFTLVLWENENQIGNERPYLYDELFRLKKYNAIRGFNMDKVVSHDATKYRYRYYQWFNSLIERNTSFLNANVISGENLDSETAFGLTVQAVSDLTNSLKWYQFPDHKEEIRYPYSGNTMAMAGGVLALSLLYLYLLLVLKQTPKFYTEIYFALMIVLVVASYAFSQYLLAIFALCIMIFAISLLTAAFFYLDSHTKGYGKLFWMLGVFFGIVICALIGISALLGGIEFYTSTWFFYGVKISLLFPVVTTALNAYMIYYGDKIPLKELPKTVWNRLKTMNKWLLIPISLVVVLFVVYYLIRSGKSDLLLPLEDRFRKWLTDVFYIRPRFKEFLIGYPAFCVFLYACVTNVNPRWKTVFGICATVLFTSILNTFCHTFTRVTVSLWRVANGMLAGLIVSALLLGIIILIRHVILPKIREKQGAKE